MTFAHIFVCVCMCVAVTSTVQTSSYNEYCFIDVTMAVHSTLLLRHNVFLKLLFSRG